MKKLLIAGWICIWISLLMLQGFSSVEAASLVSQVPSRSQTTLLPTNFTNVHKANRNLQENLILFSDLGMKEDRVLQGSFDSMDLNFSLPPEWEIQGDGNLELNLTAYFSSVLPGESEVNFENTIAGYLTVILNQASLQKVVMQGDGDRSIPIVIPAEALVADPLTGLHTLTIQWDASSTCSLNLTTSIIIHPDSQLDIPHHIVPLSLDLSTYPKPIFQLNMPNPASVSVIIPSNPDTAELQAAIGVITGLGRLTSGNLILDLVPSDKITDQQLKNNHLIFVGVAQKFDALKSLEIFQSDSNEDGVIQVFLSPWNKARALLVVTGQDTKGVIKAARVVTAGTLIPTNPEKTVSVIMDVNEGMAGGNFVEDRTFSEIGQTDISFTAFGTHKKTFLFTIPPDMAIGAEAYLDLSFNHSQLIDYLRSGIMVRINGSPIGSIRLGDNTAGFSTLRMIIPPTALMSGGNQLEIQVDLLPRDLCSDPRHESYWITIFSDSLLHIPFTTQPIVASLPSTLGDYPRLYSSAELNNTAFVLPINDPGVWKAAAKLAFNLGMQTISGTSSPEVLPADAVPETALAEKYLILVGRPSQLPYLANLAPGMAVNFGTNNDIPTEMKLQYSFKYQPGTSLGYLELASGDLLQGKPVLAVLGSSEDGIQWAVNAITNSKLHQKLSSGNFAIIQGSTATVLNIQPIQTTGQAPQAPGVSPQPGTPVANPTVVPGQAFPQPTSTWVLPTLVLSFLLIFIILGYQLVSMLQARKK